ncbi:MAG: hypothetical protein K2Q34_05725 [Alphaproteobacteria bacterium]|nr:hypothetical protein [Alphaproteobacteria bacterium]
MTVVIGIYCSDGIVIAADSALTINGMVEQTYSEKITCVNNDLVIGFAGDLGFSQRYKSCILAAFLDSQSKAKTPEEIVKTLCTAGLNEYLSTHQANLPIEVPTSFVVGFVHNEVHCLILLPEKNFQPVMINQDMPFCSIGSGHYLTNPFLCFIKNVFWKRNTVPEVSVGIFSALMALNLAIQVNPGGINGPVHVAVIRKDNENKYYCRKLHEDELSSHQANCDEALRYFAQYSHVFDKDVNSSHLIPQPPKT